MDADEIVSLSDLEAFLEQNQLFMTLRAHGGVYGVALISKRGGEAMVGEAGTITEAIVKAWKTW